MRNWMTPFSWLAAVAAGALAGGFLLNLFWPPNFAELALSVGFGASVMFVLRRIIISELEKHDEFN